MNKNIKKCCTNCKYAKFRRYLTTSQKDTYTIFKAFLVSPDPDTSQRGLDEITELTKEFCKIKKSNMYDNCEHWERKWWKFWIEK